MFLLDTDHVVIAQQLSDPAYSNLVRRISAAQFVRLLRFSISFHEQVMGWNAYISKARDADGVVQGYAGLQNVIKSFAEAQVLPFDSAGAETFDDLRRQRVRIGTMDLRIASVALSRGMAVLTRNRVDFDQVPGLNVEDWTQP